MPESRRGIGHADGPLEPTGVLLLPRPSDEPAKPPEPASHVLDHDAEDLLKGRDPGQHLRHTVIAQRQHSLLARDLVDRDG